MLEFSAKLSNGPFPKAASTVFTVSPTLKYIRFEIGNTHCGLNVLQTTFPISLRQSTGFRQFVNPASEKTGQAFGTTIQPDKNAQLNVSENSNPKKIYRL